MGVGTGFLKHRQHGIFLRMPNLHPVVLNPTGLWKILWKFLVRCGHGLAIVIEQHRP